MENNVIFYFIFIHILNLYILAPFRMKLNIQYCFGFSFIEFQTNIMQLKRKILHFIFKTHDPYKNYPCDTKPLKFSSPNLFF